LIDEQSRGIAGFDRRLGDALVREVIVEIGEPHGLQG
jgi:hypothetical protein